MTNAWYPSTIVVPPDSNIPHINYLFNLINGLNNSSYDPGDFTVNDPSPLSSSYINGNTEIEITPLSVTGYSGTLSFSYNRLDISNIFNSQLGTVNLSNVTLLSQILPQLNDIYGTDLLVTDIVDSTLPVVNPLLPNVALVVTINIVPTSIKYTGTYDYVLNYTANIPSILTDSRRVIVAYNGTSQLQNSVLKYYLNGTVDNSFNFTNNVSNIVSFSITNMYYRPTGNIVLNGVFNCTINISGVSINGIFSTLIVDQTGTVLHASVTPYYTFPVGSKQYSSRYNPFIYSVGSSVVRYLDSGLIDTTFNYSLSYIPGYIYISSNGNIYTISEPFIGPNPFNNNVQTVLIRIDRLLSSGSSDATFNPIIITSSSTVPTTLLTNTINVTDLVENSLGNIAILLNSTTGVGKGTATAVINGIPLVANDNNGLTLNTWMPIISLLNNGMIMPSFNNSLNIIQPSIITEANTVIDSYTPVLNYTLSNISWMSYKPNPINGILNTEIFSINNNGAIYYSYEPSNCNSWPIINELYVSQWYSDNTVVLAGSLQSVNINGTNTVPRDFINIINPDGSVILLITPQLGIFPNTTCSVNTVVSF
jgi:hypothetical protein